MREDTFEIRSATPGDEPRVREFLEGLSRDSRWNRYHAAVPRIRSWMVNSVVGADHVRHEALLAISDGRVVGVAEWGRTVDEDGAADIAVVVSEDCRRHGVARKLMRRLARRARVEGIETFTGTILSMNTATVALVKNVAPVRTFSFEGGTIEVRVPLSA